VSSAAAQNSTGSTGTCTGDKNADDEEGENDIYDEETYEYEDEDFDTELACNKISSV
jgi:hypothetical protein